jgi:hypothetical protein
MKKYLSILAGLLALVMFIPSANASIVYEDVGFLDGFEYGTDSFIIGDAGTYKATLTDFEFPAGFDYLALIVTSATDTYGSVELTGDTTGMFSFHADPGTYFASIIGDTGGGLGLYGVEIASVPEPSTWLLLSAGLLFLGYQLRKEQT